MMIKRILTIVSLTTLVLANPVNVLAQTTPLTAGAETGMMKHEMRATAAAANIDIFKTKADQLITKRVNSLNTMLTRINDAKRLSADQKTAYATKINADLTALANLKAKIDADTDIVTLKTDIKSIYTQFRVYAVFDPQTNMLSGADAMTTATDQLTVLATKLKTRVTEASSKGNNVDALKTLLTDMQNKIADAKTQYASVESTIAGITPDSYNTNPTGAESTLKSARATLKIGRTNLQTALQDAKQIYLGLKAFKQTVSPTSTTAVTVTP